MIQQPVSFRDRLFFETIVPISIEKIVYCEG